MTDYSTTPPQLVPLPFSEPPQQVKKHVDNVTHSNNRDREYWPRQKKTNRQQTNKRAMGGLTTSKKRNSSDNERGNDRHEKREQSVSPSNSGHQNQRPTGPPRVGHIAGKRERQHTKFCMHCTPTHKIPGSLVVLSHLSNHATQINQLISAK